MTGASGDWLQIVRGERPLIVSLPHTGTEIPEALLPSLASPWLARKDTDWWVEKLYDFAASLGATVVRTALSRTVIDVNRDPSGRSLYPGQATTGLCPTTTFDGEALYRPGAEPDQRQVALRRARWFDPYHAALKSEIERLRQNHPRVVLYDAHSIRSRVPRLFAGALPHLNIGTYQGRSCAPELARAIESICADTEFSWVLDGRFKGGYITRHYGAPDAGVHAVQMELACRGYMEEPEGDYAPDTWPTPYEERRAADLRRVLTRILQSCLEFASP